MGFKVTRTGETTDYAKLLEGFDCIENNKRNTLIEERKKNKEKLLPYVLEYMEGVITLHNLTMVEDMKSTTGKRGILGLDKLDLDKELQKIIDTDFGWEDDNLVYRYNKIYQKYCKAIWLNKNGKHIATPHLDYSMTSCGTSQYAHQGLQEELKTLASILAKNFPKEKRVK